MKRVFVLLFLPVFMISTIGITMTSLYCAGKVTKTGYEVKACCKDVKKGGCCEKKAFQVKVKDHFVKAENSTSLSKILDSFTLTFNFSAISFVAENPYLKNYRDKAPPLKSQPCYILFHSLII